MSTNDDNTLGFTLELYSRYMEAARVGNTAATIYWNNSPKNLSEISQRAKKVVSNSPGLVDFAIGLVNSVFNLPDGQVMFFEEFD